jgi:hypothetical protein
MLGVSIDEQGKKLGELEIFLPEGCSTALEITTPRASSILTNSEN